MVQRSQIGKLVSHPTLDTGLPLSKSLSLCQKPKSMLVLYLCACGVVIAILLAGQSCYDSRYVFEIFLSSAGWTSCADVHALELNIIGSWCVGNVAIIVRSLEFQPL